MANSALQVIQNNFQYSPTRKSSLTYQNSPECSPRDTQFKRKANDNSDSASFRIGGVTTQPGTRGSPR